ncbi:TadE family type IV pilus minor pilin [Nocardia jinanensis]|uniref:TadE family type IV pilus minor pilin n=1 Tax=Nocardia jinanensis TaxID=382504 RepID=UPI0007386C2C|nr:TadE family type IV pilus minor pilin [Nocardia jinanensis]
MGTEEAGSVTVEAAIALGAIAVVAALCVGAVFAAVTQVRCVDAAREAARLAARGDRSVAVAAARRVAPAGAEISLRDEGDRVIALVMSDTPLLPVLELRAEAVAVKEPDPRA